MKDILLRATGLLPPAPGNYRQGIGRANYELLKAIIDIKTDLKFSFYCNQFERPFYSFKEWPIRHYWNIIPNRFNSYCAIEAVWRKCFTKYDLFHITDNYAQVLPNERFVVTIHDLKLYEEIPQSRPLFEKMTQNSLGIVTCSEYTKSEILRFFAVESDKITVIPWGINHELFYPRSVEEINKVRNKYHIKNKYFFACSCAHPRKNARDILKAFRMFSKEVDETSLVLAWSNVPKDILEEYKNEINAGSVIFLDYVDDEELAILYSGAMSSFLISSLEGFGFPILESMACGTNCITCRNSSMTEIGDKYAIFVEEHNIASICEAMKKLIQLGKGDVEQLADYASTYTWKKTASLYIDFYKKFL